MSLLIELWHFMVIRKKYWLLPILIMTLLLSGLLVLTEGSVFAPFLYPFF